MNCDEVIAWHLMAFNAKLAPMILQVCRWPVAYSSELPIYASHMLPIASFVHLLFALWAYSMIAVPQSGVVGGNLMSLLDGLTNGMKKVWENTNQLTPTQVRLRMQSEPLGPRLTLTVIFSDGRSISPFSAQPLTATVTHPCLPLSHPPP